MPSSETARLPLAPATSGPTPPATTTLRGSLPPAAPHSPTLPRSQTSTRRSSPSPPAPLRLFHSPPHSSSYTPAAARSGASPRSLSALPSIPTCTLHMPGSRPSSAAPDSPCSLLRSVLPLPPASLPLLRRPLPPPVPPPVPFL